MLWIPLIFRMNNLNKSLIYQTLRSTLLLSYEKLLCISELGEQWVWASGGDWCRYVHLLYIGYVVTVNCMGSQSYIMPLYSLQQIGRGTQEARGTETAATEGAWSSKSKQTNRWTHETRNQESVTGTQCEPSRCLGEWTFYRKMYDVRGGKSGYLDRTDDLPKSALVSDEIITLSLDISGSRRFFW
jgi:hypothetical protein